METDGISSRVAKRSKMGVSEADVWFRDSRRHGIFNMSRNFNELQSSSGSNLLSFALLPSSTLAAFSDSRIPSRPPDDSHHSRALLEGHQVFWRAEL